jgi:glutamine synthetase
LDIAERCRVTVNIFHEENRHIADKLETMPLSCYESAEKLKEHAAHYLEDDVFNERIINGLEKQLKFFRDQALNQQLKNDNQAAEQYIEKFMHWG